jgi:alanine racemase
MNRYSFSWRRTGPLECREAGCSRGGSGFFRRGFVSHTGYCGEPGVLRWLSAPGVGEDRIGDVTSWVEVSEERLRANYRLLVEAAGRETAVLAVVKANAYGHGARVCAPVLAEAGAEWLGVADAVEGVAVREVLAAAGVAYEDQPRILVMSGLEGGDAETVVSRGLTPVVWEQEQMEWLAAAVGQHGGDAARLPVHLEIDTGMARQGVAPGEGLRMLLHWLKRQPRLLLEGVLTHFASPEEAGSPQTLVQRERFEEAIASVAEAGLRPGWVHAGSSSTIDNDAVDSQDAAGNMAWLRSLAGSVGARSMMRSGIALYGYCLPIEPEDSDVRAIVKSGIRCGLEPVMTWKTRVTGLREVQAGDTVGYNATFTAERTMRLALLPVGYSDGVRRELSGSNARTGGWVMVKDRRAAIVGRVSMNLTVVDVTEIPAVAVGDEVVVLGDGVTADDHARLAHTISYEIVCGVRAEPRLV